MADHLILGDFSGPLNEVGRLTDVLMVSNSLSHSFPNRYWQARAERLACSFDSNWPRARRQPVEIKFDRKLRPSTHYTKRSSVRIWSISRLSRKKSVCRVLSTAYTHTHTHTHSVLTIWIVVERKLLLRQMNYAIPPSNGNRRFIVVAYLY